MADAKEFIVNLRERGRNKEVYDKSMGTWQKQKEILQGCVRDT